jgi:hypothetical protein
VEGEGQDLAQALGAESEVLGQALTLYIPSRDGLTDEEFDNQAWVREAADSLLGSAGGTRSCRRPPAAI